MDFEVILVDDGSADRSRDAAEGIAQKDPRVKVVALSTNRGVSSARNAGLALVSSPRVLFLDCDDPWPSDLLSVYRELIREFPQAEMWIAQAEVRKTKSARSAKLDRSTGSRVSDAREVIRQLATREVSGYLWNKLIATSLLGPAPFPKLTHQEDLFVVVCAVAGAQLVARSSRVAYVHVKNSGGASQKIGRPLDGHDACLGVLKSAIETRCDGGEAHALASVAAFTRLHLPRAQATLRMVSTWSDVATLGIAAQREIPFSGFAKLVTYAPKVAVRALAIRLFPWPEAFAVLLRKRVNRARLPRRGART